MPEVPIDSLFPAPGTDPEFNLEVEIAEIGDYVQAEKNVDKKAWDRVTRLARLGASVQANKAVLEATENYYCTCGDYLPTVARNALRVLIGKPELTTTRTESEY